MRLLANGKELGKKVGTTPISNDIKLYNFSTPLRIATLSSLTSPPYYQTTWPTCSWPVKPDPRPAHLRATARPWPHRPSQSLRAPVPRRLGSSRRRTRRSRQIRQSRQGTRRLRSTRSTRSRGSRRESQSRRSRGSRERKRSKGRRPVTVRLAVRVTEGRAKVLRHVIAIPVV